MRIVTWNCAMALHRKWSALLALRPDVAVLCECASPDVAAARPFYASASAHAWVGDVARKGLGVVTFGSYRLTRVPWPTPSRFSLAVHIDGAPTPFQLLALWTQARGYVEEAHAALDGYTGPADGLPLVVAGDLNSQKSFDHVHTPNHSDLVARLEHHGLFSAYHEHHGEPQGGESRPTFFLHWRRDKPFHLDYVFLPNAWRGAVRAVEVGTHEEWGRRSDHMPITVELDPAMLEGQR